MRFIDEALIKVSGGHGGPGCVSFRRETFIPRGGPDGGDGGAGGDVIFVATRQLSTLQDFRFKRAYLAKGGEHGSGANKAGRDGEDTLIRVPVGTIIRDAETGEELIDFTDEDQRWVACTGGRGGKGNTHFTSSVHQAPKFAQPGEEGTHRDLRLELKLLADVAIVGFPNAGKSTLISAISAAHPKIADYAFTTLVPHLGVVDRGDSEVLVVADVPGLIEGAHRGLGLGHRFLKHIERASCFIHLLDGAKLLEEITRPDLDEKEFDQAIDRFVKTYEVIRQELRLFSEALSHKPELLAVNKSELLESDPQLLEKTRSVLRQKITALRSEITGPLLPNEPFFVSAVTGKGISELLAHAGELVRTPKLQSKKTHLLPDDPKLRQ